jgi:hypothetical protein
MKTILIPTEDHDSMPAVLETARLVARRFDSYVEGFVVHPAVSDFVAVDPVSSLTLPQIAESDGEIEHHARQLFESFMEAPGSRQRLEGCGNMIVAGEANRRVRTA